MKTFEEQRAEVNSVIKKSPKLEIVECKEIIAEDDDRLLVRSVGAMKVGTQWIPTFGHELWYNKIKYRQGIASEFIGNRQNIYMMNIAGADEEVLITDFKRPRVCNF